MLTTGTSVVEQQIVAQNGIAATSGPGDGAAVVINVPLRVAQPANFAGPVTMGDRLDVASDIHSGGSMTDSDGDPESA